jgi:hypothetical protein
MSKNIQTWHEASFEYDDQLPPLAQVQFPNGSHVTNYGTLSNLKLP